ncbi:MAG: hypothetical protein U1E87_04670 [Alphaproteobacteria bacterium]
MTLYLTFEALEKGELALDTVLTASKHAARQAPSKLDLHTDDKIVVDDAIARSSRSPRTTPSRWASASAAARRNLRAS